MDPHFLYLSAERHLVCLNFLATRNRAAKNMVEQKSLWATKNLRLNSPGTKYYNCLKDIAMKRVLMTLCYIHRSVPCSAIIRDVSS